MRIVTAVLCQTLQPRAVRANGVYLEVPVAETGKRNQVAFRPPPGEIIIARGKRRYFSILHINNPQTLF